MASMKEIRAHIRSVEQTLKITNAMYLIASSNLRKARKQLTDVEPYFRKIESTITDILYNSPKIEHRYFDQRPGIPAQRRKVGYVVITSDKGLAGAYNHNILKLAEEKVRQAPNVSLYIVGQVGRAHFTEQGIPVAKEFLYTAQNPNIARARDMSEELMDLFTRGELDEIYVLYTDMRSAFHLEPTVHKLLPLSAGMFPREDGQKDEQRQEVSYLPSVGAVMDRLVAGYLKGELFGALVESYCSDPER